MRKSHTPLLAYPYQSTHPALVKKSDSSVKDSPVYPDKIFDELPQRIMIVDDNADAAQTLGMLLEVHGHDCKVVYDSQKALAMAADYKPRYVFLDLSMPEIDGYDLCQRMRAIPELAQAVFIAQTGWSDRAHVERAKNAGFHHHLVKPIAYKEIEAILK